MTISDGFAIVPKRCDKCGRRFLWEGYSIYYKMVGIECYDLKCIKWKRCNNGMDRKDKKIY